MRSRLNGSRWRLVVAMATMAGTSVFVAVQFPLTSGATSSSFAPQGEIDCNGASPIQQALRPTMNCADIRGFTGVDNANTWGGRFYDNGHYIGHDEPDMTFLSSKPLSGSLVSWTETLGSDPSAAPTATTPGSDVAHWFELSVAPWFSMAMCDPNSYPIQSCRPVSDANAPAQCTVGPNPCANGYTGGGSAFMEMQFYPPGMAPFPDSISCDNTHWCSALTIDSLECTYQFVNCNFNCEEPINFAFIQRNGVPTGPVAPDKSTLASATPNNQTLLMNPGDRISVNMGDFPVSGGGFAFTVFIYDLTTHQSGFMQASAANGFANTNPSTCVSSPFNFQPEYNTASAGNIIPWAALQTNISTEYEIGHFTACTSVSNPGPFLLGFNGSSLTDEFWTTCNSPYEANGGDAASGAPEASDALCYPLGDTHGGLNAAPNTVAGCADNLFQGGDLDYDGSGYWPEWPTSATATSTFPASFVQSAPQTLFGSYSKFNVQTDAALSEPTCTSPSSCTVPPPGPGNFYPYWSLVSHGGSCAIEFGNVSSGSGVNSMGGDAQYGTAQFATLGFPEFIGPTQANNCSSNRLF